MSQDTWTAVDEYLSELLAPSDEVLDAALQTSREAALPPIQVAPNQGKLLMLLAQAAVARRILEIGTLGGYSTLWLARALPSDGRLVTLEAVELHATVARSNIARAGLSEVVEVRLGQAHQTLAEMVDEGEEPFDFIFIDADKPGYPEYLRRSLQLSSPGALIVADNMVSGGSVVDAHSTDPGVVAKRQFLDLVASDPRLDATAIQTVGVKGYDGFVLARVRA